MIIVFAEDHTVAVLPDAASVRRECEAVDVENGVYTFFDELGRRLVPRFNTPVERRSSFFSWFKSVGGGNFELELDPQDQGLAFQASVQNAVAIESNQRFQSLADLARLVAENRTRMGI